MMIYKKKFALFVLVILKILIKLLSFQQQENTRQWTNTEEENYGEYLNSNSKFSELSCLKFQ